MQTYIVKVQVKPECVDAFIQATQANVIASRQEPGIARFDFCQQEGEPTQFVLIEVYRGPEANAAHKETAHYKSWRDAVAEMMAAPRSGLKYVPLVP